MINPYENVDWETAVQVKSVSHIHVLSQSDIEKVAALGYEHLPISHYNPSIPRYPLEEFFTSVPDGMIGSPNSEKVKYYDYESGHANALGSFLEGYGVPSTDTSAHWKTVFRLILKNLQYEDGGGITLNHPKSDSYNLRVKMLDFDPRVLGLEIYNNMNYNYIDIVKMWDRILATGRKCWGFCVIDWPSAAYEPLKGSSILVTPEKTEHECLKAYRNGAFYSMIEDRGIRFTNITADSNHIECAINTTADIAVITQDGTVKTVSGTEISYTFKSYDVYARIEVTQDGEYMSHVYSNPVILKPSYHYGDERKKQLLLLG